MGNINDLQKSFQGILVITCNTTIFNLQSFIRQVTQLHVMTIKWSSLCH